MKDEEKEAQEQRDAKKQKIREVEEVLEQLDSIYDKFKYNENVEETSQYTEIKELRYEIDNEISKLSVNDEATVKEETLDEVKEFIVKAIKRAEEIHESLRKEKQ